MRRQRNQSTMEATVLPVTTVTMATTPIQSQQTVRIPQDVPSDSEPKLTGVLIAEAPPSYSEVVQQPADTNKTEVTSNAGTSPGSSLPHTMEGIY